MIETRLIDICEKRGDFVTGEDGYVVYWPVTTEGALNARDLRTLADELDRRNEATDARYREYFKRHPVNE